MKRWHSFKKQLYKRLPYLQNWLIACLIFLIPSNLFLKMAESRAYVNGLQIDYLLIKFYASDIMILMLLSTSLLLWLKKKRRKQRSLSNKYYALIFIFLSLSLTRQFFTHKPISAVFYFFKLLEILALIIFLSKNRKLLKTNLSKNSFLITLVFQSAVGFYQFIFQKSFYGFKFLGETNLQNYYGIARASFAGADKILPYGTTAHPNIFAGFIVIYSLIYLKLTKTNSFIKSIIISLNILFLFLVRSWSASLVFVLALICLSNKKRINLIKEKVSKKYFLIFLLISSLLFVPTLQRINLKQSNYSLSRRSALNTAACKMIGHHPFLGIGLNNFTANLNLYTKNHLLDNFVQPVHHLILLILAENGIIGILIFLKVLQLIEVRVKKETLIKLCFILLPIIILDHYLITTQTGLLLLSFSLFLI